MSKGCKIMSFIMLVLLVLVGCTEANMSNKEVLDKIEEQTQTIQTSITTMQEGLDTKLDTIISETQTLQADIDTFRADLATLQNTIDTMTLVLDQETKDHIDNTYGRLIVTQYELEELMKSFYTKDYTAEAKTSLEVEGYKNLWDIFNMAGGTTNITIP